MIWSVFRALGLALALCAAGSGAAVAQGNPASLAAFGLSTGASEAEILRALVAAFRADPGSYGAARALLARQSPELLRAYLREIGVLVPASGGTAPANAVVGGAAAPGLGAGAGLGLGLVVAGAALALAGGGEEGDEQDDAARVTIPGSPVTVFDFTVLTGDATSFRTSEYARSTGLDAVGAAERYAAGGQGQGVTIAILDTGIDLAHSEFDGKIDLSNSYSYYGQSDAIADEDGHGTAVAGVAAAARNGSGTQGIAFGSQIVVFRGVPGEEETRDPTSPTVFADALLRSVGAGAAVMNNSWSYVDSGGRARTVADFSSAREVRDFLGSSAIDALDIAVANDLAIVFAASNDSEAEVSITAGLPLFFPRYDGYIIAAVATDTAGQIAGFSNRCGQAMDFCLAAPGISIRTTALNGTTLTASGTSFAAPLVSGAVALLKSQSPELTTPEISQILFDTAQDLGAPGVDAIYGQGMLDVGAALLPQGQLMVYEGEDVAGPATALAETGIIASAPLAAAIGQALDGQALMVGDAYDRGYAIDAGAIVTAAAAPLPDLGAPDQGGEAVQFGVTRARGARDYLSPLDWVEADLRAFSHVALGHGLRLSTEMTTASTAARNGAARLGLQWQGKGESRLRLGLGRIDERGEVLGSAFFGAAGQGGAARTRFIELGGRIGLPARGFLDVTAIQSVTEFSQDGLVTGGEGLRGRAGRVALGARGALGLPGTVVAALSSPLQITSGRLDLSLPQARPAAVGAMRSTGVIRREMSVEVEEAARPIDLTLSYQGGLGLPQGRVALMGGLRFEPSGRTPFLGLQISGRF
ncbi:S8 family peptidase [Poseidonocella sedimentorum]|uniref:S8 family peptidase n=1 Tax=Poseidonocella sedimentorum TaxID=871652 RepID=UPI0015A541EF|nr:S8 family peptidase [Poseidonocella sedimentorum]